MVIVYYECDLFNMLNRIDFGLRLQDHPEQTNHHGPDQQELNEKYIEIHSSFSSQFMN